MTVRITITSDVEPAPGQTDEELLAFILNEPRRLGTNPGPGALLAYYPMSLEWMAEHGNPGIKRSQKILPTVP